MEMEGLVFLVEEMLHWVGHLSQLKLAQEIKAFIGSHTKNIQMNTDFRNQYYTQRPMISSVSHTPSLGFLMVTRLLPGAPGLHPPRFKCCERECLSLSAYGASLNASDWAMYSCLKPSVWPRESNAPNGPVWITCPFLMQVKHTDWFLLGKLRYGEKADGGLGGKNKDVNHRCEVGHTILFYFICTRYHLKHQPSSGSPRPCKLWNPGGYTKIPPVQAQLLDQYEVSWISLLLPWAI